MKKLFFALLFFFLTKTSFAQQQDSLTGEQKSMEYKKNAVYMEFGGNASPIEGHLSNMFSINYDRVFVNNRHVRISVRTGSNFPFKKEDFHVIPFIYNIILGEKVGVELGFGGELIYYNSNYRIAYGAITSVIGIRYQNFKKRIIIKIALTPTIATMGKSFFDYYFGSIGGLSVGYCF